MKNIKLKPAASFSMVSKAGYKAGSKGVSVASTGNEKKQLEQKFVKRLLVFGVLALVSTSTLRFFLTRSFNSDKIIIEDDGTTHVIGKEIPRSPAARTPSYQTPKKASSRELDADASYKEAMAFIEAGDYQTAKERLEAIIKENPDHIKALTELGMVYLIDLRQPDMALPLFEKVIIADPTNQLVVNELIGVYEELGRQEEGVGFLQGLLEKNPENPAVSLGLGQIFLGQTRTGDAIPYLEKAIQHGIQPDYVYMDLGDAYSKQGQREKAIDVYRQAVDMADRRVTEASSDPALKQINEDMLQRNLLNYARELGNFGRYDEASQALQRIIQQSPDHQGALAELKRYQALKRGG